MNKALIILVPKKPNEVGTILDFRPISLVHTITKLMAKELTNRLRPLLVKCIILHQSTFLKGRYMHDNRATVWEILHHCHKSREGAFIAKVDFIKSFNTVNRSFLLEALQAQGLPGKWLRWLATLLSNTQSSIIVNRQRGPSSSATEGIGKATPSHLTYSSCSSTFWAELWYWYKRGV